MAPLKYPYRLLLALALAFVVNGLIYVVSLSTAVHFFGTGGINIAFPIFVCMICSVLGLAVLRKFGCSWSAGLLAAYSVIGLSLLFAFAIFARAVSGHGTTLRWEVIVGITLLQGVAFVLPAIRWARRILADGTGGK